MHKKRLVVIGGGAAGFFCAVNAARLHPTLDIIILEKTGKLLSKVKVSGGGRCNVTHACYSIAEMVKKYPRGGSFLKKAFHHFFTNDTIAWFEERGVRLVAEDDGRIFPVTNNSQSIIDCLLKEAAKYHIVIKKYKEVKELANENNSWYVVCKDGELIKTDFVCVASGGYPKLIQYEWLQNTTHDIEKPVPSLFTFNMPGNSITSLMGIVAQNVQVKIMGTKIFEQGPLLITHWGMSGPAILKLSAWAAKELAALNYHFKISVNWLPGFNENSLREKFQQLRFNLASQKIINRNPFALPARLWEFLLTKSGIKNELRWANLPAKEQNLLIRYLCADEYEVKGKTTFKEEFVTAGGIQLNEIDYNTMQSKKHKGLFFAGEIINVDGITGGYNFQNAWTTGYIAANAIK
ncbi:MAG: NAD(P)/FAD-dependent oxidoreductase [Ferruginibacter sp.]|nr:NAD(P)/FAD-dependent oxidoreductase [Bacteroidota bacterium]MBX2919147.1 NAD(P)/FAD-dependent oxidoreductase [Ferruginibacter sp.]